MTVSSEQPLDRLVLDCCRELFSAYGLDLDLQPAADIPNDSLLCGVLGFGGQQIRGAVIIIATPEPLEQTNPVAGTSQRDWICELANQLAGRLKSKLLTLGVEILLATPAGLSGNSLYPFAQRRRGLTVLSGAGIDTGIVCAWADYESVNGFELPSAPLDDAELAVPEGEMVLF